MPISVNTEKTENHQTSLLGWVLFDGHCPLCRRWARRLEPHLVPRGFLFVPLQVPWVRAHFHLPEEKLLGEMRVLMHDGETYGGADSIVYLARYIWWARPLAALALIPGVRPILRAAYRFVAARRACLNGACGIQAPRAPDQAAQEDEACAR